LIAIALASATTGVGIAIASAAPNPGKTQATPPLPVVQLAALGAKSASGLNDARVKTALVVATREHAAENWLEPGAISLTAADPRAYLVVLAGRFICTRCSYPAGAKPPRGRSAQIVWIPGQGVRDFGLTQRVPSGLDRLGHAVKIDLVARARPGARSRADAAGRVSPLPGVRVPRPRILVKRDGCPPDQSPPRSAVVSPRDRLA
jgi:hypothetical protein